MSTRALLRLDASHALGLGHAVRCRALSDALRDALGDVSTTGLGCGAALPATLPAVERWAPPQEGPALLSRGDFDLLLVDHPEPEPALLAAAAACGTPVVRVDDFGFAGPCALVVNGAPGALPALYPGVAEARALCGPRFALLRDAFARARRRAAPAGVVAVVGSGAGALPFARAIAAAAGRLEGPLAGAGLDLVVGAAFPEDAALACQAREPGSGLRIHRALDAEALAARLAGAALALTTGGMIVSECLCVGVPLLAFAQVPAVAGELDWLEAHGALLSIDAEAALDPARLAAALAAAAGDPLAARRAACGRALFDGRGARRAARAMADLVAARRDARAQEARPCASP